MAIKFDTSKFTRNLVNNHKLTPHLDKAIGQGDFEWTFEYQPKELDTAWHPSGMCTASLMELYEGARKGVILSETPDEEIVIEKKTPALYKTFMVGHFWHQYLQYITVEVLDFATWDHVEVVAEKGWGNKKLVPENRQRFYPSPSEYQPYHWVRGSADVCPCVIPGEGEFLVDFKTMKNTDFRQNEPPAWTADKWECQVNIYMDLFDMERAILVGVQKDSPHDLKEFYYERNQPLIDAIYTKWKIVSECLDEDVPPSNEPEVELPLLGPSE